MRRQLILTSLAVATLCFAASHVSAQSFAGEVDVAFPLAEASDAHDVGFSLQGRGVYALPLPVVTLQLETGMDYSSFGVTDTEDTSTSVLRYIFGVRIGVPGPFIPKLYGHVGYGTADTAAGDTSLASVGGLAWDIGLASDLLDLPLVAVGLHLAYKVLSPAEGEGDPFTWLGLGLHVQLGM